MAFPAKSEVGQSMGLKTDGGDDILRNTRDMETHTGARLCKYLAQFKALAANAIDNLHAAVQTIKAYENQFSPPQTPSLKPPHEPVRHRQHIADQLMHLEWYLSDTIKEFRDEFDDEVGAQEEDSDGNGSNDKDRDASDSDHQASDEDDGNAEDSEEQAGNSEDSNKQNSNRDDTKNSVRDNAQPALKHAAIPLKDVYGDGERTYSIPISGKREVSTMLRTDQVNDCQAP
ncbi:uncharacterized protein KY384_002674 [Bacidia gigantensis]|uniref:uncharacterized protein n=1 Tax=Bacidia gigantensis TaxID=2732470 RepID=UPI001D04E779|nr:uncharacterized protein KY384_002674 [Bacidia gigantensis]KAG8532796.1 hypothetical protein KY384_002674 [Bacidia gigantensis]